MKILTGIVLITILITIVLRLSAAEKPKVIVLLGAPGAGKGSQAIRIVNKQLLTRCSATILTE